MRFGAAQGFGDFAGSFDIAREGLLKQVQVAMCYRNTAPAGAEKPERDLRGAACIRELWDVWACCKLSNRLQASGNGLKFTAHSIGKDQAFVLAMLCELWSRMRKHVFLTPACNDRTWLCWVGSSKMHSCSDPALEDQATLLQSVNVMVPASAC